MHVYFLNIMKKTLIILFLLSVFTGFTQVPDYSNLLRKDKLKLMNYYGFVILKSKDTIFTKVDFNKYSNTPKINSNNELILTYPDELEIYSYLTSIPLESIETFYFGYPHRLNIVKKSEGKYVNLEIVEDGKFKVYKNISESGGGNIMTLPSSQGFGTPIQTAPRIITTLYISKNDEEIICIDGDKNQKRLKLAKFFRGELNEKKLSKIKTRNSKVIELFKKLNVN